MPSQPFPIPKLRSARPGVSLALLVAAAVATAACGSRPAEPVAAPAPVMPDSATAAAEVLDVERQWLDALARKDTVAMARIVADEFVLSGAGAVETRQQYLSSALIPERTLEPIALSDRTARVYGEAAVTLGTAKLEGVYKGRPLDFRYRFTNVWVRRDGRWQVVASQVTGF